MRTGIFGGTFDPVHFGHLILAETVRSAENLDRLVFLPANQPPHKLEHALTPSRHRLAMLNLAVENNPAIKISDYEIQTGGISYTIDTLDALLKSAEFRNDQLYPIIGQDSLAEFHTWKDPERIVTQYQVLCVRRPDVETEQISSEIASSVRIVAAPLISISSSEIRQRIKMGKSIRFWVPEKVESYINQQGLYQ